jgi:hypothetical protein
MTHEPVRVVVLPMLRLSRELLERALESKADIEFVELPASDVPLDGARLQQIVEESGARFVVAGFERGELPVACREVLEAQARKVRVIGVETSAGEAFVCELRPHRVPLGPVTPDEVAAAIHAAASADGSPYEVD